MSSIYNDNDNHDVEPYKSAIPWCPAPIFEDEPIVNYPNKNLRIKMLFVVGPHYYHNISPWVSGLLSKTLYSPRVDAKHPEIEVNSVIEVCGTIDNLKNRRYGQLQHRVVCNNIYHHNPHFKITNPQRQFPQPSAYNTNTTLPHQQQQQQDQYRRKQWTVDDVMLLLNKYWNAARQYYICQKLTHSATDASFIAYFDLIPYTLLKTEYFDVRGQPKFFFGVLGIVSKTDTSTGALNLLIPTQSNGTQGSLQVLAYPPIKHFGLSLYPTIGSLCLVYVANNGYCSAHLPLISPPWLDADVSTYPTEFTTEMFEKSFYMTDPATKTTLLKLVAHHNKLSQNIVTKKYNENNPPPHNDCIDINVYLDMISEFQNIKKKMQQDQERKERGEQEKLQQQKLQQEKLQRERLQQLRKDTSFILDVLKYHNDVIISPTVQKVIQQHPFLEDYITTQITTPFEHCQQEMYDYLDEHYSSIADHTLPSPLVSNMYYDYQQFIRDIQHKLVALSSNNLSCSLIQCNISNIIMNNNTSNSNNSSGGSDNFDSVDIPRTTTATPTTTKQLTPITASSLLQLQSPHIYHHTHPADWERARFPQRHHQNALTSSTTTMASLNNPTSPPMFTPFLSTTNTSLHHILNKCDSTAKQLMLMDTTTVYHQQQQQPLGSDDHNNMSSQQPPLQHDSPQQRLLRQLTHEHHQLATRCETLCDLFIYTKQHNDELLQQIEELTASSQQQSHVRLEEAEERGSPTRDTTLVSFVDNTLNTNTTMLLQSQVDHLKQQLQVKDKQLETKDQQLAAKDKAHDLQLAAKDKQLVDIREDCRMQLCAKDEQLVAREQQRQQQLQAKDQQIQQLIQAIMSFNANRQCGHQAQPYNPEY